MPRKRPNLAARWSAYQRRYRGTPGVTLAAPLSPITFPTSQLRGLVEIAPGADLTADPATWSWVDITQWVRHDLGVSVSFGRRDQASNVDPSRATLKLDNRDGRFSRRNPVGPYYGQLTRSTPIRMAVDPGDGMHYRYHGFVNEWPKRWDKSGNDSTVTIQCGGILRRLGRTQPLRSAMYRSVAGIAEGDYVPLAYWPMEDGENASQFASGLVGGSPMTFNGTVSLASDSDVPGSQPLPTFESGTGARFTVPAYTDTDKWILQTLIKLTASCTIFDLTTAGTGRRIVVAYASGTGTIDVDIYDSSGASVYSGDMPISSSRIGVWLSFTFSLRGDTATDSFNCTHQVIGTRVIPGFGDLVPGLYGKLLSGKALTSIGGDTGMGHLALFTDANFSHGIDDVQHADAATGWAGELAHERIIRVCREEQIRLRCVAGTSAACGPQPIGTVIDVLRDAERADVGGVLYEHEFGLGYQALSERTSQPVQLSLDFDQGHVNDPPEADDSDLRFRNQWTVARDSGSEYTFLADDYSDADGLLAGQTTVNAYRDDQLQHIAGWLVHRDTADEDYWTGLKLNFARTPDIIPAWTSLPFGARLQVANPPSQADPGDIDAIVEGWSERWDQVSWTATLNTSPASTLEVPVWDDPGFLWDSGSSSLTSDISDSATSISVTTTNADDLWVTGTVAFDIEIGGEQISVTNISGATSPQTFTVTRAVNGITKGHSAGADVRLWTDQTWGLT